VENPAKAPALGLKVSWKPAFGGSAWLAAVENKRRKKVARRRFFYILG